ncbi:molybdopterin synthase sulfur carrier subunit [Halobacteriales archaeon SW_7_68_16]|nr:MAG: molybdopterin synthase sulfur carrier subunit [Halobacteriales archaeon SW_7_68_16]
MEWLLYAGLVDRAGTRRVTVETEPGASVREALAGLVDERPALDTVLLDADSDLAEGVRLRRNASPVDPDDPAGGEIAVYPPRPD